MQLFFYALELVSEHVAMLSEFFFFVCFTVPRYGCTRWVNNSISACRMLNLKEAALDRKISLMENEKD